MSGTETTTNRHAVEELREKAAQVKRDLRELSSVAKEAAQEKWVDLKDGAVELEGRVENRIREHPVQSVLIAAGVGLLIGLLVSRRNHGD